LPAEASIEDGRGETELIEKAKDGDQEIFGMLVRRYQDDLYRYALSMVNSREEAQDLAAETFVKAWKNLRQFRNEARFKTWLWRILVNACRSHLRRRYLQRKLFFWQPPSQDEEDGPAPDEQWVDPSPVANPEKNTERCAVRQALIAARTRLSTREQEVVALKYDRNLKITEIAALLSLSPNTVKVFLFRATRKMAAALSEYKP
jgi:RNA polymerase sigma-70 factor (ECF subfamily)